MRRLPHPACPHPHPARGLYLIELLAVLIVLGAVLLITAQIASTASRASAQAARFETTTTNLDLLLDLLRRDVWGASALRATTGQDTGIRLDFESPGGVITRWHLPADAPPTRTSPGGLTRTWANLPRLTLTVRGPLVTVEVPRENVSPHPQAAPVLDRLTLPCQHLLSGGAQ